MEIRYIASELLLDAVRRHRIHLSLLVADTGIWANPAVHRRLTASGSAAMFPLVRRARIGQGEERGQHVDGVRLDDNNYANVAIKRATGLGGGRAQGFESCHIWPLTCYDERYHTAVANLVLLPRALAGLSDHDAEIQKALQYRAYELYEWWPEEMPTPVKPDFYPDEWREPQPDSVGLRSASTRSGRGRERFVASHDDMQIRITRWAGKPLSKVHKMIALVAMAPSGISRSALVEAVGRTTGSKNPYGAVASMLTTSGTAYGRVLEEVNGVVQLHPALAELVRSHDWDAG